MSELLKEQAAASAEADTKSGESLSSLLELARMQNAFLKNVTAILSELSNRLTRSEGMDRQYLDVLQFISDRLDMSENRARRVPAPFLFSRERSMAIVYAQHDNILAALCDTYGSDKGSLKESGHPYPWPPHTYTDFYNIIFQYGRRYVKNVFECGIGTNNAALASSMGPSGRPGASLRVWRDYFPHATVYGADIDRSILFEEERIITYHMDQTSPQSIAEYWGSIDSSEKFDVMIDDGLHTFDAGSCLFENSIHRLAGDGVYAIEDVGYSDIFKYQQYFSETRYAVDYIMLGTQLDMPGDNNMVIIRV